MKDPFCKGELIDNPVFEKMVNRARYAPLAGLYTKRVNRPESDLEVQLRAYVDAAKKATVLELRERLLRGRRGPHDAT